MLVDSLLRIQTWVHLGLRNIMTVAIYRSAIRIGYYRRRLPIVSPLNGPFFSDDQLYRVASCVTVKYFTYHKIKVSSPPHWFVNPWNEKSFDTEKHWSELPDFISDLGDIKTVWELSRFDWLPKMAWAYKEGDREALGRLELWLRDWVKKNPVNKGINWKCGQEASFRCLNLLVTAQIINGCFENPRTEFLNLLADHIERIAPTLHYAMAQDNNHGISEAAALFVVGHYLCKYGKDKRHQNGKKMSRKGRYWLENRVCKLILADGSFSQHSVTYHRLMLDVISLVELLRIQLRIVPFTEHFYKCIGMAVIWLQKMTDDQSGDAPNLGANDGAYLFNLEESEYRDFRPSVQLAAAIFLKKAAWADYVHHPLLDVFNQDINLLEILPAQDSSLMSEGGYVVVNADRGWAMLRLPVYRFRPSHADALHLDIWHDGINWVRDAGTYSYNGTVKDMTYFPGTASHSSICFDDRDQMPRLGRFLFGAWLQADIIEWNEKDLTVRTAYTDSHGACHVRELCLCKGSWQVFDSISGFSQNAVLRWHLAPENWRLDGTRLYCDQMDIIVDTDNDILISLTEQPESGYYMEQHMTPVLEIICTNPGIIKTVITFK